MGRKRKEPKIPGLEEESIQEIDEAADIYYDRMQERVALSKKEDEAKDNLIDKMSEHKINTYIFEGHDPRLRVDIVNKKNVSVKPVKGESNGEAEE